MKTTDVVHDRGCRSCRLRSTCEPATFRGAGVHAVVACFPRRRRVRQQHAGNVPSNPNCVGENVSPPLAWTNVPAGTKSFAFLVYDQGGRNGLGVVHWVAYNVPATVSHRREGDQCAIADEHGRQEHAEPAELHGPVCFAGEHRQAQLCGHGDRHRCRAEHPSARLDDAGTDRASEWPGQGLEQLGLRYGRP